MSSERHDPDGVPWPEAPIDQPASAGNVRQLPRRGAEAERVPAASALERGLVIEDLADVADRVDAARPPG